VVQPRIGRPMTRPPASAAVVLYHTAIDFLNSKLPFEVAALDQSDVQPTHRGVASDRGAVDAAADDREIVISHCVPLVPMIEISCRPRLPGMADRR